MKIGDRVYVAGYIDEIRKDVVIIRNDSGYFGTEKHNVFVAESVKKREAQGKWIPMSERPPEVGQYVLVSMDMNYVATATFKGDYWESTFDLDWEEVLAWQPTPKPFEVKK